MDDNFELESNHCEMAYCVCATINEGAQKGAAQIIPVDKLRCQNLKTLAYDVPCTKKWIKERYKKNSNNETVRFKTTNAANKNIYKLVHVYDFFDTLDEAATYLKKFTITVDTRSSRNTVKRNWNWTPPVRFSPKKRKTKFVEKLKSKKSKVTDPKEAAQRLVASQILRKQTEILYDEQQKHDADPKNYVFPIDTCELNEQKKTDGSIKVLQDLVIDKCDLRYVDLNTVYHYSDESSSDKDNGKPSTVTMNDSRNHRTNNSNKEMTELKLSHTNSPMNRSRSNSPTLRRYSSNDNSPTKSDNFTSNSSNDAGRIAHDTRKQTIANIEAVKKYFQSNERNKSTSGIKLREPSETNTCQETLGKSPIGSIAANVTPRLSSSKLLNQATPLGKGSSEISSSATTKSSKFSIQNFIKRPRKKATKKPAAKTDKIDRKLSHILRKLDNLQEAVAQRNVSNENNERPNLETALNINAENVENNGKTFIYKTMHLDIERLKQAQAACTIEKRVSHLIMARWPLIEDRMQWSSSGRKNSGLRAVPEEEKTDLVDICVRLNSTAHVKDGVVTKHTFNKLLSNKLKYDRKHHFRELRAKGREQCEIQTRDADGGGEERNDPNKRSTFHENTRQRRITGSNKATKRRSNQITSSGIEDNEDDDEYENIYDNNENNDV